MAVPCVAWLAGRWLRVAPVYGGVLVIFASLPVANSAYVLATRMGGDGPGVAWLMSASNVLAMATMSIWISVLV